jgi:hypothetical protein
MVGSLKQTNEWTGPTFGLCMANGKACILETTKMKQEEAKNGIIAKDVSSRTRFLNGLGKLRRHIKGNMHFECELVSESLECANSREKQFHM